MDGSELLDEVESAQRTELSRLGSSKSLYADTVGEMEPAAVLRAGADATAHAGETFEQWSEESDHELFADAGSRIERQFEAIVDELEEYEQGDPPKVATALRNAESLPERLGATVGWTLVTERKSTQSSGFFTGQAKPQTASTFRGFGDDYDAIRAAALETLESTCNSDEQFEQAVTAATDVIQAAYDEYFETLEDLGMNPKPVC